MNSARIVRLLAAALALSIFPQAASARSPDAATEGRLEAVDANGKSLGDCPLKHTDVSVDISGFVAHATVRQQFHNPRPEKIEAVYVFPLSHGVAVNRMTMKVGGRILQAESQERGRARTIYESAKARGNPAGLLEQQRPNVFTQSVANIEPGAEVDITIEYCESLKWVEPNREVLAPLRARAKIDDLIHSDLANIQRSQPDSVRKQGVLDLGLRYRLLTQYTSFVAVQRQITTPGGPPTTISVPAEMPKGVGPEGIFGPQTPGVAVGSRIG